MKRSIIIPAIFLSLQLFGQREIILLDKSWKFHKGEVDKASQPGFDDAAWQIVTVPHDWAISGPFDKNADAQTVMVTADGERKPALRTGRTGSLPWPGVGWYRKEFFIPAKAKTKKCFIEFDGAMSHAIVFLNGEKIGEWPYGYSSFSFELTDKIRFGEKNILAVRLENFEESSRWYPGAGIYRNVRLVLTQPVHIRHWGTFVSTPTITPTQAIIKVKTEIEVQDTGNKNIGIETSIRSLSGKELAHNKKTLLPGETTVTQSLDIYNPLLWNIETPWLYTVVSKLTVDGVLSDIYKTPFGIRAISFDNNNGFFLNNKKVRIQGVCLHHDLGPLGIAINYRALERQLEMLKEMGCNAIRTSHNPPAPELLELCDKMGFVVMDEAFDEWKIPKTKNGYNKIFDDWAEKDLRTMIRRDRNHPSIILWSIGNEVPEQSDSVNGAKRAKFLVDIAHDEDPTRPVTSGFNSLSNAIKNGLAAVVDVVGINYRPENYAKTHSTHPDWKLIGSETESAISSRGEYMFPVVERKSFKYKNKQSSSYDREAPNWGHAPDVEFAKQDSNQYVAGQFTWTGFDYLGEPTPYNNDWPSHSSYFGIIDLAGLPKDRFYLYQANWTNKKTLHILPHWTWPGREGEVTPVQAYTSYNSAELFVNGKSQGIQKKDRAKKYGYYRLCWDSVVYQPGEIRVVAFDDNGKKAAEKKIQTAAGIYRIQLMADKLKISADGKDLSFITVTFLDKKGSLCPAADNNIRFAVEGAAILKGVANGDPTNIQSLTGSEMKAFHGQCVVVIQALEKQGNIKLTAVSDGLSSSIMLTSKKPI